MLFACIVPERGFIEQLLQVASGALQVLARRKRARGYQIGGFIVHILRVLRERKAIGFESPEFP